MSASASQPSPDITISIASSTDCGAAAEETLGSGTPGVPDGVPGCWPGPHIRRHPLPAHATNRRHALIDWIAAAHSHARTPGRTPARHHNTPRSEGHSPGTTAPAKRSSINLKDLSYERPGDAISLAPLPS